jgi:hypothetical protein
MDAALRELREAWLHPPDPGRYDFGNIDLNDPKTKKVLEEARQLREQSKTSKK